MSYTFSDKKATRFRLDADTFRTLIKGDMVRIEKTSGEPVEFFMADIGIELLEEIFNEEMAALYLKLLGANNAKV